MYKINPAITAGFCVRAAAFLLDSLIILLLRGLFSWISLPIELMFSSAIWFNYTITDIFFWLLTVAYFIVFTKLTGATLGKNIFRIRVVDLSQNPGWLNIIYRETIGRFLNSIMFIGYLTLLVDREHCTFADKLCDTRVIYPNCYIAAKMEIETVEA